MTLHTLTPQQRDLALALVGIVDGVSLEDAFAVFVSIIAGTCNKHFDQETSRNVAVWLSERIVATVDAGQRGELRMHGEVLQ